MGNMFRNVYEDSRRAAAYDELRLGGTYRLVFDNLPALLEKHVVGRSAMDFGCGTGRSSRFLKSLGFDVVGVDISVEMVSVARKHDPVGDYRVIRDGDFSELGDSEFDLVMSAFTFDNVPGHRHRARLFASLASQLSDEGVFVNVVSTPEIYVNEWVTFTTKDYPDNHCARSGDMVLIKTTEYSDSRPVEDILWTDSSYRDAYGEAGLRVIAVERPLATGNEGVQWKSELTVPPWAIYILRRTV